MTEKRLILEIKKRIKKWENLGSLPEKEFVAEVKKSIFQLDTFFLRYLSEGTKSRNHGLRKNDLH